MIIVLVTGGRFYDDAAEVDKQLSRFVKKAGRSNIVFVHGRADGLDTLVDDWCANNGIPSLGMRAPWEYHRRKGNIRIAGPKRNQWMLDITKPTHGIVFPGNAGTADMHARMRKANLIIKVVE